MARIELREEFFEDEVREGFYVPACIKQAWGAQIQVLNDIDEVCSELGIRYFADWGTFLGAVRHGGFVPWDDDFDLCMFRDDYNRFLDEGLKRLPEGYEVYNLKNRKSHEQFIANVVARSRICFEPEHLERFHGFPYISAVDIFIIDYISPYEDEHNRIKDKAKRLLGLADAVRSGVLRGTELRKRLDAIGNDLGISIPVNLTDAGIRQFLDVEAEKLFAYFVDRRDEAKQVVQMMPWGINDKNIMPTEYYKRMVNLPFEGGTLPVPLAYDDVMKNKYGDYMQLYKNAGAHDYPFFEKSRANLQEVLDFEIPEYRVDAVEVIEKWRKREKGMIRSLGFDGDDKRNSVDEKNTYKDMVNECLCEMHCLVDKLVVTVGSIVDDTAGDIAESKADNKVYGTVCSKADDVAGLCGELQQLAIDLGTYMETVKGEGYDIVHMLEDLCESLYELSVKPVNEEGAGNFCSIRSISGEFEHIAEVINRRREVLFLPFKDKYWYTLEPYYRRFMDDEDTDVYVIPIPYYYKDYKHVLKDMQYRVEGYPSDVVLINYDDYDYTVHHPDMIFVQNPYDDVNDEMSVPPFFFSDKLLDLTDRLVYVPWFETYDFTRENEREYKNMKYYCTVPGVINADTVIVPSDTLRSTYIDKLCDFAGEETRSVWEDKIVVRGSDEEASLLGLYSDSNSRGICSAGIQSDKVDSRGACSVGIQSDRVDSDGACSVGMWSDRADSDEARLEENESGNKNADSETHIKTLLYYPDVSDLIVRKDQAMEKMEEVIQTFEENADSLKYIILRSRLADELLREEDEELYDRYNKILHNADCYPDISVIKESDVGYEDLVSECTAYYGDAGHLAHLFRNAGKPVMIQNYEIFM